MIRNIKFFRTMDIVHLICPSKAINPISQLFGKTFDDTILEIGIRYKNLINKIPRDSLEKKAIRIFIRNLKKNCERMRIPLSDIDLKEIENQFIERFRAYLNSDLIKKKRIKARVILIESSDGILGIFAQPDFVDLNLKKAYELKSYELFGPIPHYVILQIRLFQLAYPDFKFYLVGFKKDDSQMTVIVKEIKQMSDDSTWNLIRKIVNIASKHRGTVKVDPLNLVKRYAVIYSLENLTRSECILDESRISAILKIPKEAFKVHHGKFLGVTFTDKIYATILIDSNVFPITIDVHWTTKKILVKKVIKVKTPKGVIKIDRYVKVSKQKCMKYISETKRRIIQSISFLLEIVNSLGIKWIGLFMPTKDRKQILPNFDPSAEFETYLISKIGEIPIKEFKTLKFFTMKCPRCGLEGHLNDVFKCKNCNFEIKREFYEMISYLINNYPKKLNIRSPISIDAKDFQHTSPKLITAKIITNFPM